MMQLSHEVHAWEDMAYALLGDNHIESDSTRELRTHSTKISAIDENVKVVDFVKNMKVKILLRKPRTHDYQPLIFILVHRSITQFVKSISKFHM